LLELYTLASSRWISSLNDKVPDNSVELGLVVIVFHAELVSVSKQFSPSLSIPRQNKLGVFQGSEIFASKAGEGALA
jgi:hypothetical protein